MLAAYAALDMSAESHETWGLQISPLGYSDGNHPSIFTSLADSCLPATQLKLLSCNRSLSAYAAIGVCLTR